MERMKQAEHWLLLNAQVEPDGGVEAGLLVDQDVLQLRVEDAGFLLVAEVAALAAPAGDGVDNAVDELLDGALADGHAVAGAVGGLGAGRGGGVVAEGAAEVLGGDYVGGVLGPGRGDLDVLLLEHGGAVGAGDEGGAVGLPRHLIVGVDVRRGEVAAQGEGNVWSELNFCVRRRIVPVPPILQFGG